MGSDALLDPLVSSPRLGLYVDRLTHLLAQERARRERFHETLNDGVKQEFINGEVVVHSPVTSGHERASSLTNRILGVYVDARKLGRVAHEKLMISLSRNDYEPDVCYFGVEKAAQFTASQMKFPAPDLIAEVLSGSTERTDRGIKFDDYAAHGVREYWILDPVAQSVEQYLLEGDAYVLRMKSGTGLLQSVAISGFETPVRALFDEQENLAAIRALLVPH
jgi:Uma2 family endonuclease